MEDNFLLPVKEKKTQMYDNALQAPSGNLVRLNSGVIDNFYLLNCKLFLACSVHGISSPRNQ